MKMEGEGFEYNVTLGGLVDGGAVVEMIKQYFQHTNAVANATCLPDLIPSVADYYSQLNLLAGMGIFTVGGLALLLVFLIYIDTLRHVLATCSQTTKTHTTFVISIYPVVAVASFCAVVVPRAQLVSEAVIQVFFMGCLYQLFCLFVAYSGGESQLIAKVNPNTLNMRVGPCCCWPCCICLPSIELTKERVTMLRLLVLQLPIVQGFTYMVMLVMWAEHQSIYQVNSSYLQPLVVGSILLGIWGLIMTLKMTSAFLKEYHLQGKFIVLQLVLLLTKFQGLFAKIATSAGIFSCNYPLTPILYSYMIYNNVLLWEMVLLSVFARILYRRLIPIDINPIGEKLAPYMPQTMCSLDGKTKSELSLDNNNSHVIVKSESRDHMI